MPPWRASFAELIAGDPVVRNLRAVAGLKPSQPGAVVFITASRAGGSAAPGQRRHHASLGRVGECAAAWLGLIAAAARIVAWRPERRQECLLLSGAAADRGTGIWVTLAAGRLESKRHRKARRRSGLAARPPPQFARQGPPRGGGRVPRQPGEPKPRRVGAGRLRFGLSVVPRREGWRQRRTRSNRPRFHPACQSSASTAWLWCSSGPLLGYSSAESSASDLSFGGQWIFIPLRSMSRTCWNVQYWVRVMGPEYPSLLYLRGDYWT